MSSILPIGGAVSPFQTRNDQNAPDKTSANQDAENTSQTQQSGDSGASNETQSTTQTQETQPVAPVEANSGTSESRPARANAESVVVAQIAPSAKADADVSAPVTDEATELARARAAAAAYGETLQQAAILKSLETPVQTSNILVDVKGDAAADPYDPAANSNSAPAPTSVSKPDATAA